MTEKSGEDALIEVRRRKAAELRARGQNPFENAVDTQDRVLIRDLRAQFSGARLEPLSEGRYDPDKVAAIAGEGAVHVVGRLLARRGFGKATFLRLRDESDEIQLFGK